MEKQIKKKNPLLVDKIYNWDKIVRSSDFEEGKFELHSVALMNVRQNIEDYDTQGFRLCRTTKGEK